MSINVLQEDREKIDALDWLVFNDSQRAEAIKQTNALIREYLGNINVLKIFVIMSH